jgi:hypothetical protein
MQVPQESVIMNRLKNFYSTRRNNLIVKGDKDRKKKRKLAVKTSQRTFVSIHIFSSLYEGHLVVIIKIVRQKL